MGCEGSLAGATPSPAVLGGEMLPGPLDVPVRPHPAQQDPNPNSACGARGRGRGVGMGRKGLAEEQLSHSPASPLAKASSSFSGSVADPRQGG